MKETRYTQISPGNNGENENDERDCPYKHGRYRAPWYIPYLYTALPWLAINIIVYVLLFEFTKQSQQACREKHDLYSPARGVIEYEQKVFISGFSKEKTEFFGAPDERTNALWEKLLSVGIVTISQNEADQFVDPTAEDPNVPGTYTTSLDVFHQLHCLYNIRKQVYSPNPVNRSNIHLDHCIDYLRQSIMCSADISPISWRQHQHPHHDIVTPDSRVVHMCRRFDKIWDWSAEHRRGREDIYEKKLLYEDFFDADEGRGEIPCKSKTFCEGDIRNEER